MDALSALRLQLEWGADEALLPAPCVSFATGAPADPAPPAPAPAPTPAPTPAPAPDARFGGRRPHASAPAVASPEAARSLAAAAGSIEALAAALRSFDPDGLSATATSLVLDLADAPVGLALVGDLPGEEEDRTGVPFAGPPGALLDRMLASIELDRAQVMLAHLIPWRPPGGRPASATEITLYLPFLQRQLELRGIQRLLLLGIGPVKALLGRDLTFARARGAWRRAGGPGWPAPLDALATFAPAQLLTRTDLKPAAWADLRMLRRTLLHK